MNDPTQDTTETAIVAGRPVSGRLVPVSWYVAAEHKDRFARGMAWSYEATTAYMSACLMADRQGEAVAQGVQPKPILVHFIESYSNPGECWSEDVFSELTLELSP